MTSLSRRRGRVCTGNLGGGGGRGRRGPIYRENEPPFRRKRLQSNFGFFFFVQTPRKSLFEPFSGSSGPKARPETPISVRSGPSTKTFGIMPLPAQNQYVQQRSLGLRTLFPLTAFKNAPNPKFVQKLSRQLFFGVPVRGTGIVKNL